MSGVDGMLRPPTGPVSLWAAMDFGFWFGPSSAAFQAMARPIARPFLPNKQVQKALGGLVLWERNCPMHLKNAVHPESLWTQQHPRAPGRWRTG